MTPGISLEFSNSKIHLVVFKQARCVIIILSNRSSTYFKWYMVVHAVSAITCLVTLLNSCNFYLIFFYIILSAFGEGGGGGGVRDIGVWEE